MQNRNASLGSEPSPLIQKHDLTKRQLLLPKIIFSPRNNTEEAQIIRTSPDALTKRDAMSKLYPFEIAKNKYTPSAKGNKQTIFSSLKSPKKPQFFSKRVNETEPHVPHHKFPEPPLTTTIEESRSHTITTEIQERSKYDLRMEEEGLESEERPLVSLEVKGINSSKPSSPQDKKRDMYVLDEKKKSKENLQDRLFEQVFSAKNRPIPEQFNDVKLIAASSINSSGIAILDNTTPSSAKNVNINLFKNTTPKPNKLYVDTFGDRADIDKLPNFELTTKAFSKYSHLLNLSNPSQVNRILNERAKSIKAATLGRSIHEAPVYSSSLERASIQKSMQRNQIKNFVTHERQDRRTSANEIIRLVNKLDAHKIVLPSSKKQQFRSEPKFSMPVILPSLHTTDAAEENLVHSFKYIPVVKNAMKGPKHLHVNVKNGISPRRRLQIELDRKEVLITQLEANSITNRKSPRKEGIGSYNSIEDSDEEESEEPGLKLGSEEELYRRALMMADKEENLMEKLADDIAMSARFNLCNRLQPNFFV